MKKFCFNVEFVVCNLRFKCITDSQRIPKASRDSRIVRELLGCEVGKSMGSEWSSGPNTVDKNMLSDIAACQASVGCLPSCKVGQLGSMSLSLSLQKTGIQSI